MCFLKFPSWALLLLTWLTEWKTSFHQNKERCNRERIWIFNPCFLFVKIRSMILTHSNLEYQKDTKMGNYDHQPSIVFCSSHRNCRNWPVFVHLQVCGWMQDIQQDEWLVCLVYETGINLLRSLILQHHIYSQFFRKIWNVDQLSLCSAFITS